MAVQLVLRDRLRMRVDSVRPGVLADVRREFEHSNPQYHLKKRIGRGWWDEPVTITTWRQTEDGWLEVPRGGLARVRNILWDVGVDWELDDRRTEGSGPAGEIPPHKLTLFKHQEEQVRVALDAQGCIVRSATGTGKTTTLLALASRLNLPTLVVVPTSGLYKQWRERVGEELGLALDECGSIFEGKCRLAPLTIALQASLAACKKDEERWASILEYFGALLSDEVQYAPAATFFDAFDSFPAKYRIGMSASEKRKDKKEFLAHDLFGKVAHEYTREQGVADKVIIEVECRVIPTEFRAPWYGLADEDHPDLKLEFTRLVAEMGEDPDRDHLMVEALLEEARAGSVCIALCHQVEHVMRFAQKLARSGVRTGLLLGGKENGREFDRTKRALKEGSIQVAVGTYKATGTGIDVPRVDVVACVTPIAANEGEVNQVRGRACRAGKASARMLYLWDQHVYPRHLANLRRWCPGALIREGSAWVPAKKRG